MSHLLQWRELAYLCKQGVSYPFSGSDYDKSSRPTTIKIGRVTRLFLNGITDVFSFSPHLRRTSGIIHPHMFIINATKHHQCPLGPGRNHELHLYISHLQAQECHDQYNLSISDNLSAGNVRHLSCFHNNVSTNQSQKNNILPALLKYGDGKEHVFQKVVPLIFNQFLFCILGCTLCISRHSLKIIKDH